MFSSETSQDQILNDLRTMLRELLDEENSSKSSYSRLEDILALGEKVLQSAAIATPARWSGIGSLVFNILAIAIAVIAWVAPNPSSDTAVMYGVLIAWCIALIASIMALWHTRIDWRTWLAVGATTLGAIAVGAVLLPVLFGLPSGGQTSRSSDFASQIEAAAWQAFTETRYTDALTLTDIYLRNYGDEARKLQEGLAAQGEARPQLVTMNDSEKRQLFDKNGKLNATASCYILRGRIFEREGRKAEALAAYEAVLQLPHAIRIDRTAPGGAHYLLPIDEAQRRIADLKRR